MEKTIISEGKTTNEAIENGLKELNVSKDCVDIKVLDNEDKRSFFSILTPRVVKVEMTLKERKNNEINKHQKEEIKPKKEIELSQEEQNKAKANLETFMKEFVEKLPEGTTYQIESTKTYIHVNMYIYYFSFILLTFFKHPEIL